MAPEFTLLDPDGKPVSSRELLARGPLVISFYRGVWCPYCNLELQALQAALPEIAARGASLVAISPQTAAEQPQVAARQQARLPDPERRQKRGRRCFRHPLRAAGLSDRGSTRASRTICPSSTMIRPGCCRCRRAYVIGTDGIIAYAEVNPDYTQRPDPANCCRCWIA